MPHYKFTLRPLDRIFFGQEKSPFKEEYYQLSRLFPQQTNALGLLRYETLRRADLLRTNTGKPSSIVDANRAKLLIGQSSFAATTGQSFGIIQQISPISIYHPREQRDYFVHRDARELTLQSQEKSGVCVSFGGEQTATQLNYLTGLDVKDYSQLAEQLVSLKGKSLPLTASNPAKPILSAASAGVFYQEMRTGITKNYGGETQDNSFFKIETLRMRSPFCYAFTAEIDTSNEITDWTGSTHVRFGGDSCTYQMTVRKATAPVAATGLGDYFLLLSDAWVEQSIFTHCQLAIADTQHFRNLKTEVTDTKFNKRPVRRWDRSAAQWDAHEGRLLLKKGSWLIAKDAAAVKAALEAATAFRKIGYNHFWQFADFKTLYQE